MEDDVAPFSKIHEPNWQILYLQYGILAASLNMRTQCQQDNLQILHQQPRYTYKCVSENGRGTCKHNHSQYIAVTLVHEYGFNAKVGKLPLYSAMLNCTGPTKSQKYVIKACSYTKNRLSQDEQLNTWQCQGTKGAALYIYA